MSDRNRPGEALLPGAVTHHSQLTTHHSSLENNAAPFSIAR